MRTTISLEDRLAEAVKERASEAGTSVSAYIAKILDDALKKRHEPGEQTPFRLVTVGGSGLHREVDLDRPRQLEIEDDEVRWRGEG